MSTSIPKFKPDAEISTIIEAIDELGCAVVENTLPESKILSVCAELEPVLDIAPKGQGYFVGQETKRISGLMKKIPSTRDIATNEIALGVLNGILGRHCERIQLHISQAISVGAQAETQPLHRDRDMYGYLPREIDPMMNVMWAVSPFTKRNGGTVIAMGSHKWEDPERQPVESELSYAEMPAGSCLFFLGSVLHGAGQNVTNERRTGLCLGYTLGWLRQFENQYLHVPPEVAKDLSPELAGLIGYAAHRPQLGLFEARDPMELLAEGLPENQPPSDVFDAESEQLLAEFLAQKEQEAMKLAS